ncbi:hypothetical protein McanMca71_004090 [Microsporum canis]
MLLSLPSTNPLRVCLGHGAHKDFGLITLRLQGDVPGLEVWDELTGRWGNPDFIVVCRKSCKDSAEDEKYCPVSVEDYVRGKYQEVYHRGGVYSLQKK